MQYYYCLRWAEENVWARINIAKHSLRKTHNLSWIPSSYMNQNQFNIKNWVFCSREGLPLYQICYVFYSRLSLFDYFGALGNFRVLPLISLSLSFFGSQTHLHTSDRCFYGTHTVKMWWFFVTNTTQTHWTDTQCTLQITHYIFHNFTFRISVDFVDELQLIFDAPRIYCYLTACLKKYI